MFTIQYTKGDGGRALAMAMLLPPPTKPILYTDSVVLAWKEKEEYAKPRTKGRGVSYGKIGLMTMAAAQDLLSGLLLVL